MRILAVDTSSNVASAAIVDDEKLVCECVLNNKLTHSQTLLPMIDEVLKKSELSPSDIDVFAVSNGPGSFTGLRIGVTTVKGLAHAVDKPVCGVNTLEALAYNLPFCPYIISPIMDARREQVYNAFYKWEDGVLKEIKEPRAISLEDCMKELLELGEKVVFLGDGVAVFREKIKDTLKEQALFAPQLACTGRAACVAEAAKNNKTLNYGELAPQYLRKSQAEREAEEREAK
ncbi:MAG: tRNA (adenosine(37)-N6)-threonylcarbamoyltransferase complex dimerization subunit type 1 TsaB [Clostridia bacterium]|nr:tRNA (adenosine(37)-N6)-threonylcarbamoyltransferase complex dimerization subunit type 1 TsaB [Clostridia bacterium]